MTWKIEFTPKAAKELLNIDKREAKRILNFLKERVVQLNNPRTIGKPLKGELREYWRYRVGKFRILCYIDDTKHQILVVKVAHRKEIYRGQ